MGRGMPGGGLLVQKAAEPVPQTGRETRVERRNWLRQLQEKKLAVRRCYEWGTLSQTLVHENPDSVEVRPSVDIAQDAAGKLRSHVMQAIEREVTSRRLRQGSAGQPPIDRAPTLFRKHDVARLETAVQDPGLVGSGQDVEETGGCQKDILPAHRAARQPLAKREARQEFRYQRPVVKIQEFDYTAPLERSSLVSEAEAKAGVGADISDGHLPARFAVQPEPGGHASAVEQQSLTFKASSYHQWRTTIVREGFGGFAEKSKNFVMPIRLYVIDDHELVRDGLKGILAESTEFDFAGGAARLETAWQELPALECDLVLLDLNLAEDDGLLFLRDMASRLTRPVRVLIFSIHYDEERVIQALELGAQGYLVKSAGREELFQAARVVAGGGVYLHAQVAQAVGRGLRIRNQGNEGPPLSERELEILECVRGGLSNSEIADRLFLSPNTVKAHLKTIFHRLGTRDRTHAVVVALERGLLAPVRSC